MGETFGKEIKKQVNKRNGESEGGKKPKTGNVYVGFYRSEEDDWKKTKIKTAVSDFISNIK